MPAPGPASRRAAMNGKGVSHREPSWSFIFDVLSLGLTESGRNMMRGANQDWGRMLGPTRLRRESRDVLIPEPAASVWASEDPKQRV